MYEDGRIPQRANLGERQMSAPTVYHLTIERFRGIKALSWYPGRGVNVILGGGDVGKTTILDAIDFF
jgi:AAA domain